MNNKLAPGFTFIFTFAYRVPEDKTVPFLFPEMPEGQAMPKVFATGYLVGLFEMACIKAINCKIPLDPGRLKRHGHGPG